ncbi:hypothetical protein NPIL_85671 [Nephila pilipes]|uniref:Uncharacterized protein n=1 Tax=Nephila pilipes TaxID=299642 RepID=A0A8X6QZR6_NEPPI|nr:hypothetical protein NPIL_85671 [Nephila pilipes]
MAGLDKCFADGGCWISKDSFVEKRVKNGIGYESDVDDFSDSDNEEVNFDYGGSDSSVSSVMEDDSSSDSDDLAEARQWCLVQIRSYHLHLLVFRFTSKPDTNFRTYNISNVLNLKKKNWIMN